MYTEATTIPTKRVGEVRMKEIPMVYVRSNQVGILLFIVLALVFQQPIFLIALWLIQIAGLIYGARVNVFVQIAKPFFRELAKTGEKQAQELQRFNNTLGVAFLTLSLISFTAGWFYAGYVFAGMLFVAAFAALLGYCIGCTIYYQFKQLKHKLK